MVRIFNVQLYIYSFYLLIESIVLTSSCVIPVTKAEILF